MKGFAKRIFIFIFSIVLLVTFTTFPASADDINFYIYMPNTTDVVAARYVTEELDGNDLRDAYNFDRDYWPEGEPIHGPTGYYNCHSYAWYDQEYKNNHVWIEDPSEFYNDHRYCIVPQSEVQVGDKICYFDNMGTSDTSDDKNVHSGIVSAIRSDGTVMVKSKWSAGGLYEHEWYRVPYYHQSNEGADYVVYYREPESGSISYTILTSLDSHRKSCEDCNVMILEPHYWIDLLARYECNLCHKTSNMIPEVMSLIPENLIQRFNNHFADGDGAISLDSNTILCRIDGEYYYVKGTTVENAVTYVRQDLETE